MNAARTIFGLCMAVASGTESISWAADAGIYVSGVTGGDYCDRDNHCKVNIRNNSSRTLQCSFKLEGRVQGPDNRIGHVILNDLTQVRVHPNSQRLISFDFNRSSDFQQIKQAWGWAIVVEADPNKLGGTCNEVTEPVASNGLPLCTANNGSGYGATFECAVGLHCAKTDQSFRQMCVTSDGLDSVNHIVDLNGSEISFTKGLKPGYWVFETVSDIDTVLRLTDTNSRELAINDDDGLNNNAYLNSGYLTGGNYNINARPYSSSNRGSVEIRGWNLSAYPSGLPHSRFDTQVPSCQIFEGGYGPTFGCYGSHACRKISAAAESMTDLDKYCKVY